MEDAIAAIARVHRRRAPYSGRMAAGSPELKAFLVATPFFGGLQEASLDLLIDRKSVV